MPQAAPLTIVKREPLTSAPPPGAPALSIVRREPLSSLSYPSRPSLPERPAVASAPAPAAEASPWSFDGLVDRATDALRDAAISTVKGVIGVPEAAVGLADLVTGGRVGQAAESLGFQPQIAKDILSTYYSDRQKRAFQSVEDAEGLVATARAALENPSVIAQSVVESAPLMLAGGAISRGALAVLPRLGAVAGGALGEGAIQAGSAAEQTRQGADDGRLTPRQAALATASGVGTGALGLLGGKVARQLGIADVETLLAGGASSAAARRGLTTRIVYGAIEEGLLEELPQSVQEQVLQNAAEGKPLADGVDDAAVLGALSGGVMGGGAQIASRGAVETAPASPTEPAAPAPPPAPDLVTDASEALGRSLNAPPGAPRIVRREPIPAPAQPSAAAEPAPTPPVPPAGVAPAPVPAAAETPATPQAMQAMIAELRARGFSQADISAMTPAQAREVLAQPAPVAPSEPTPPAASEPLSVVSKEPLPASEPVKPKRQQRAPTGPQAALDALEPTNVDRAAPVRRQAVTRDAAFLIRWLADDLDAGRAQKGGSTQTSRREAYEQAGAGDEAGKRGMVFNPAVGGTPVGEMFEAMGVKSSRGQTARMIGDWLAGKPSPPSNAVSAARKLAPIFEAAWDGERFDFDRVPDDLIAAAGISRTALRAPVSLPDQTQPADLLERYLPPTTDMRPSEVQELDESRTAARDAALERLATAQERPTDEGDISFDVEALEGGDADLTPEAIRSRTTARVKADPEGFADRYLETFGPVLNADNASELFPEYSQSPEARATRVQAVRPAAAAVVERAFAKRLAEPVAPGELPVAVFTSGGNGSGKSTRVAQAARAHLVFDSTLSQAAPSIEKIEQALKAGLDVRIEHVSRDPVEAFTATLRRAMSDESDGRTVTVRGHAATHEGARATAVDLADRYANDPRVTVKVWENVPGTGFTARSLDWLRERAYPTGDGLRSQLRDVLDDAYASGAVSDAVYRGAQGQADRGGPRAARPGSGRDRSEGAQRRATEAPVAPPSDDTNQFGEVQSRLPGDAGSVRDQERATPADEAPFALTGEVASRPGFQPELSAVTEEPSRSDEDLRPFRDAAEVFRHASEDYRAGRLGDDAYLAARKSFERAQAAADVADNGGPTTPRLLKVPDGWTLQVGHTRTSDGKPVEAFVDWRGKRIAFAEQRHLDDPAIRNHEIAHIIVERVMPEEAKQRLLRDYVATADVSDWDVKNHFHREKLVMDLGDYVTHPERVRRDVATLFENQVERYLSYEEPATDTHDYSSTQVNLPADVAAKVQALAARIPDEDLAEDGREDEPHITVKYGLHGEDADAVRQVLQGVAPFEVTLGETSIFPNGQSGSGDVVKVDVSSPALRALNATIAKALPNTDTHQTYQPHATVAYVKPGLGKQYAGDTSLKGTRVTVDRIVFSSKTGERVEIPLEGKRRSGPPSSGTPARLSIRPGTLHGTSGYSVVGTDTLGRKVKVFAESRAAAERLRDRIKAGEDPTPADFTAKGRKPSANASVGDFETDQEVRTGTVPKIERRSLFPTAGTETALEVTRSMELPELVTLARELVSVPQVVKRFRNEGVRGNFSPGSGKIRIKADLFKAGNEQQLARTLAHEIGHLADWLPDFTLKRGNVLGRLRSLQGFLKHTFTAADGSTVRNADVRKELIAVSKLWRGDWTNDPNESYRKYRTSGKELYADAISTLLNNPGLLEAQAPTFYAQFFAELDRKPEVRSAYFGLQELLSGTRDELVARRRAGVREMFEGADLKAIEQEHLRRQELKARIQSIWDALRIQHLDKNTPVIDRVKALEKKGVRINPDDDPRYWLEERNYLGGKLKAFTESSVQPIYERLQEAGIDWHDFGEALFYARIVAGDRSEVANPRGLAPAAAAELDADLRAKLTPDQQKTLDRTITAFRAVVRRVAEEAYRAGLYKPDLYEQMKKNPAYVTFRVVDYMDRDLSSAVHHSIGTLKDVQNVADSTILKMLVTLRAVEQNRVKTATFKFLDQHYPEDIQQAEQKWNGRALVPVEPRTKGLRLVQYKEQGKTRGKYVPEEVADSLENLSIGQNNAIVRGLRWMNAGWFRPAFTGLNLGFQSFNFFRDFFRFWKNAPTMTLGRAMERYKQAAPLARVRAFGMSEKATDAQRQAYRDMVEAEGHGILGVTFNSLMDGRDPADTQIEEIFARTGARSASPVRTGVRRPLGAVIDFIKASGDFIETLPKAAGMYEFKGDGPIAAIPPDQRSFIRRKLGSPDYLQRGTMTGATNEVFLFSNAILQAWRSDFEVATDPQTRAGFWWKTAALNVAPKLAYAGAIYALAAGALGGDDDDESWQQQLGRMLQNISEYDLTNYLPIPLGVDDEGNTVYVRMPQDDVGRLIGGLVWKAVSSRPNKDTIETAMQVFDYMSGQAPTVTPTLKLVADTATFMAGRNVYDAFRGRFLFTDDELRARDRRSLTKFLGYEFQQLGGSIVWKFYPGETAPRERSVGQKILEFPVLSGVAGRWVRISSYGQQERLRDVKAGVERDEARARLSERAAVNNALRELTALSPPARTRRAQEAKAAEVVDALHGDLSPADRAKERRDVLKKLRMGLVRGQDDPLVSAVMGAGSTRQRVAILTEGAKTMTPDEFATWLARAQREGVLSDVAMKAFRDAQRKDR